MHLNHQPIFISHLPVMAHLSWFFSYKFGSCIFVLLRKHSCGILRVVCCPEPMQWNRSRHQSKNVATVLPKKSNYSSCNLCLHEGNHKLTFEVTDKIYNNSLPRFEFLSSVVVIGNWREFEITKSISKKFIHSFPIVQVPSFNLQFICEK